MIFWRPELLTSPNIPKPLQTVNPRTILGKYRRSCYKCKEERLVS